MVLFITVLHNQVSGFRCLVLKCNHSNIEHVWQWYLTSVLASEFASETLKSDFSNKSCRKQYLMWRCLLRCSAVKQFSLIKVFLTPKSTFVGGNLACDNLNESLYRTLLWCCLSCCNVCVFVPYQTKATERYFNVHAGFFFFSIPVLKITYEFEIFPHSLFLALLEW